MNCILYLSFNLGSNGLIYGQNSQLLSEKQKEMWLDLILSIGHMPPYLSFQKLCLHDDSLKYWVGEWKKKSEIEFFENLSISQNQSFQQFISERSSIELLFAAQNCLQEKLKISEISFEEKELNVTEKSMLKYLKICNAPKNSQNIVLFIKILDVLQIQ